MSDPQKIRILLFPVGSVGLVQEHVLTLDKMYELAKCNLIQAVPYNHGTELWCDEEGKLNGALPNRKLWDGRDVAFGPIFFTGPADLEGNTTSLTDEQIKLLKEEFDG